MINDGHISASAELWRENGQWLLTLYAPTWVLSDLAQTMEKQVRPQVLVMTSGAWVDGGYRSMHFTTWGGGAIGSEAAAEQQVIQLMPLSEFEMQQQAPAAAPEPLEEVLDTNTSVSDAEVLTDILIAVLDRHHAPTIKPEGAMTLGERFDWFVQYHGEKIDPQRTPEE